MGQFFPRDGGRCLGWVGILKESESKMEEVSDSSHNSPYSGINSGTGIHKNSGKQEKKHKDTKREKCHKNQGVPEGHEQQRLNFREIR